MYLSLFHMACSHCHWTQTLQVLLYYFSLFLRYSWCVQIHIVLINAKTVIILEKSVNPTQPPPCTQTIQSIFYMCEHV